MATSLVAIRSANWSEYLKTAKGISAVCFWLGDSLQSMEAFVAFSPLSLSLSACLEPKNGNLGRKWSSQLSVFTLWQANWLAIEPSDWYRQAKSRKFACFELLLRSKSQISALFRLSDLSSDAESLALVATLIINFADFTSPIATPRHIGLFRGAWRADPWACRSLSVALLASGELRRRRQARAHLSGQWKWPQQQVEWILSIHNRESP